MKTQAVPEPGAGSDRAARCCCGLRTARYAASSSLLIAVTISRNFALSFASRRACCRFCMNLGPIASCSFFCSSVSFNSSCTAGRLRGPLVHGRPWQHAKVPDLEPRRLLANRQRLANNPGRTRLPPTRGQPSCSFRSWHAPGQRSKKPSAHHTVLQVSEIDRRMQEGSGRGS